MSPIPDGRMVHYLVQVMPMSLSGDYTSEEDTRLLAENFGAVRMLDKAKLCDELIPAILQTGN
jgi:hypothetical protein